mmetsp:Transcript_51114/g.169341  ORF Transcript_51114/g.169341 Transcript_51114/m.169341 type:complete len:260 (-) Transcript_51114:259-1038(-)
MQSRAEPGAHAVRLSQPLERAAENAVRERAALAQVGRRLEDKGRLPVPFGPVDAGDLVGEARVEQLVQLEVPTHKRCPVCQLLAGRGLSLLGPSDGHTASRSTTTAAQLTPRGGCGEAELCGGGRRWGQRRTAPVVGDVGQVPRAELRAHVDQLPRRRERAQRRGSANEDKTTRHRGVEGRACSLEGLARRRAAQQRRVEGGRKGGDVRLGEEAAQGHHRLAARLEKRAAGGLRPARGEKDERRGAGCGGEHRTQLLQR